ncbi:ubiquinol cytochrome C oxidoreductase, cytochrome C1 subunit [hydrothermal vent metagenome]|uniref:Ubiquinol cytochrome C oxidoreductase, cytochrome C1 subunit n=1 Tax=hydrothermal vent metagenome TaxID=652676 RepID=A0A3B1DUH2_9ZZZZ
MRELKILAVLVFFTGVLYWGVEPFAHHQMHPHVDAPEYSFSDLKDVRSGKIGNTQSGKQLVVNQFQCQSCHSMTVDGNKIGASMNLGVMTPDLTTAGLIYNDRYLASFIANPAKASRVEHKFRDGTMHPMTKFDLNYDGIFGDDDAQGVADIVAFLKSITPAKLTNKEVFSDACQRCHSIKYGDFYGGSMKAFSDASEYMGKTPPDLSQYIRSRSKNYLHEFINDPQKHLKGTSMPRVGLTLEAEQQVISYMEEVGDSKKEQREALGPKVLGYLVIFAIFAFLWKIKIWREIH